MAGRAQKLKDPRVCRVFVSSPFGGFEKEREELVRKYLPQLRHMCQAKGLQFVAVDMRWGITEEAATDAQVVSICLREVERSDIFIGFYGQRYGWFGAKDAMLQKNIENAIKRFPWLKAVRDRSVTEMEYCHGHLNKPGALPAIFAFRAKVYDETEKEKALKAKDVRHAAKFTPESAEASKRLEDLKERVRKTKSQCLAVNDNYKTPEEGAEFMFGHVKGFVENVLSSAQPIDRRQLDHASHDAFMASRGAIFVGGENNEKILDKAVQTGGKVLVLGPSGSGKGALLCHWISGWKNKKNSPAFIYHFVECTSDSANIPDIIKRLTLELDHVRGEVKKSKSESLEAMGEDLSLNSTELADQFREMELSLTRAAAKHKIVIVIEGMGKVEKKSRTAKPLFWIPDDLPKNVTLVASCREDDHQEVEELTKRGFLKIKVTELSVDIREKMCKLFLSHHSKELSPPQLKKIVESPHSSSPLYLKTALSELCAFGRFRELNEKIDELIQCQSVIELYQVFLRRLEADFITDTKRGNIIEQVLCSIWVSRRGLSETEIMAMHKIPSAEWSPLFFAMQHVIVESGGLLRFGFKQLRDAVETKYLMDKITKLKYQKIVSNYFDDLRKLSHDTMKLDDPMLMRPADELPWLLQQMGENIKLMEVLTDLGIFSRLFMEQELELIALWRHTGLTGDQIADAYLKIIEEKGKKIAETAAEKGTNPDLISIALIPYLGAVSYFLELAHFRTGQERVLHVQLKLLEDCLQGADEINRKRNLAVVQLKLGCLYTDTGRYDAAERLHKEVLENRLQLVKIAKDKKEKDAALRGLGSSYHCIAMLASKLDKAEEAIEHYSKALEIQTQLKNDIEVADSLHNMGVMYMKINNHEKALELCTKSMKIYEELYFANLPPVIGVMLGNIAVCHRNLGQVDEAEKMYIRAIEISERAMGRQHPHVAMGLINLGTLEVNRQHFDKAETYLRESIDIFKNSDMPETDPDHYRGLEKFIYVLIKQNKMTEALKLFRVMFDVAIKAHYLDTCWPNVYVCMVDTLIADKNFSYAHDVTLAMLKSKKANEKNYTQYDVICKGLNRKPLQEYQLDKAMSKKPGSLTLLRTYIENELIPQGRVDSVIQVLDDMEKERHIGPDLYGTAIMWCEEGKKADMVLALLEHAVKLFPEEANFVASLAQKYYDKSDWPRTAELASKMCELEPDNPSHYMMRGDVALRMQDLARAKEVFTTMVAKFSKVDAVASQGKKALEMIANMESRVAKK